MHTCKRSQNEQVCELMHSSVIDALVYAAAMLQSAWLRYVAARYVQPYHLPTYKQLPSFPCHADLQTTVLLKMNTHSKSFESIMLVYIAYLQSSLTFHNGQYAK